MSLYLKYRPGKFEEIVNQKHIVDILKAQLEKGSINSNYIFFGSRGTGKTTVARVMTKALNCLSSEGVEPCGTCNNCKLIEQNKTLDFVEIDAASHTQVDHIREEILDKASYPPTTLKKKIYVIDEVHMLSKSSFNALLKIMEEPPEYLMFILATTEIEKVPETILSRCQTFNFKKISIEDIVEKLESICKENYISYEKDALELIAKVSDGALRDPIKYIEQVSILGNIDENNVTKFLGVAPDKKVKEFLDMINQSQLEEVFSFLDNLQESGIDLTSFVKQILLYLDANFLEDPKYYSNLAEVFSNILFKIKNYPYPLLIYKLELYNFLVPEEEKEQNTRQDNIHQKTTKTESSPKSSSPQKGSRTNQGEKEHHQTNNKNEEKPENNETPANDAPVQSSKNNATEKSDGNLDENTGSLDNENLKEKALDMLKLGPLKAAFRKYAKINSFSEKSVEIMILNQIQYENVFQKTENFDTLKKTFQEILGNSELEINFQVLSKEDYLEQNL